MKRNQERLSNRKKLPISAPGAQAQSQGSEMREEVCQIVQQITDWIVNIHLLTFTFVFPQAPFPLRVTRVVTAVLPSSLVARKVSVEDPPPELDNPLPEQIQPDMQQRLAEQSKKMLNKPPRRLLLESPDRNRRSAEMHQDQPVQKANRKQQHQGAPRSSKKESRSEERRAEPAEASRNHVRDQASLGNGSASLNVRVRRKSKTQHIQRDDYIPYIFSSTVHIVSTLVFLPHCLESAICVKIIKSNHFFILTF